MNVQAMLVSRVTESDERKVVSFAAMSATVVAWTDDRQPYTCAFNLRFFPGHVDFSLEMVLLSALPTVLWPSSTALRVAQLRRRLFHLLQKRVIPNFLVDKVDR